MHQGVARAICLLSELPPQGMWLGHPCCGICVREEVLEKHGEVVDAFLRLLLGLDQPDAGSIEILGKRPVAGQMPAGIVFQQPSLLPWKRIEENVALPLLLAGVGGRAARAKARELLAKVGLSGVERAWPDQLSGGMQQRATMARAIARHSPLLLLDEPFSALDDRTRRTLQETLLDLAQEARLSVIMVTHNIEEALILGDRLVVLGAGRVVRDQLIDLPRPRNPLAADFTALFLELRRWGCPRAGAADTSPPVLS